MLTRNKFVKSGMVLSQQAQKAEKRMVHAEKVYGICVNYCWKADTDGGISPEDRAEMDRAREALVKAREQFSTVFTQEIAKAEASIEQMAVLYAKHRALCEESDRRVAELRDTIPPEADTPEALEIYEEEPLKYPWRLEKLSIKRAAVAAEKSHVLRGKFEEEYPAVMNGLLEKVHELNALRNRWGL